LERAPGDIYLPTGVLECGPRDHALITSTLDAAAAAGIASNVLSPAEVAGRFPAIRLPDDWIGVLQNDGGVIRADRAIAAYLDLIRHRGARPELGRRVRAVEQVGDGVEAVTEDGETIRAGAAIIAAGPWTTDLVPELAPHLTLTRQAVGWFRPDRPDLFEPERFPVFLFATGAGVIYGFPDFAGAGVKIASHEPGRAVGRADLATQDATSDDMAPVRAALGSMLPGLGRTAAALRTCLYANTPDLEFIVDRRPGRPNIVFASACSGHGFKFASAIGEILADLALGEAPRFDIGPFALSRFALA